LVCNLRTLFGDPPSVLKQACAGLAGSTPSGIAKRVRGSAPWMPIEICRTKDSRVDSFPGMRLKRPARAYYYLISYSGQISIDGSRDMPRDEKPAKPAPGYLASRESRLDRAARLPRKMS